MQSLAVSSQAFTAACSIPFTVQDAGDRYWAACFQEL